MRLSINSAENKITVDLGCDVQNVGSHRFELDASDLTAGIAGGSGTLMFIESNNRDHGIWDDYFDVLAKPDATLIYSFEFDKGDASMAPHAEELNEKHCGFVKVPEGELREPDCR